jgi:chemotaxis family two-component system sensor kinase Cph1
MNEFFRKLFNDDFPNRWEKGWSNVHVGISIATNVLICLCLAAFIALIIRYYRTRRKDIEHSEPYILFVLFIISIGSTFASDTLMFFYPAFRLNTLIYFFALIVSVFTVAQAYILMPDFLAVRTRKQLQHQIEEKQALTQQLRIKTEQLEKANQELQNFASVASHDLNEPLRKIITFASVLKPKLEKSLEETDLKNFERMVDATARMRTLIDGILKHSKVQQNLAFTPVDLKQVLVKVIEDLQLLLKDTDTVVEIFGTFPVIHAIEGQMISMFQNLISNAIKFREKNNPPCLIDITGKVKNSMVIITVQDNGTGFDEKYTAQMFTMFRKFHDKSFPGSGMGLAICAQIVGHHQGTITAKSQQGKGATFTITLPLKHKDLV